MAQNDVFMGKKVPFGGYDDGFWGICSKHISPKIGVNRRFQAKTPKYINHNISEKINRIKTKFED